MRRLLISALFVLGPLVTVGAEETTLRLHGIAYSEHAVKEVRIQVWALGEQVGKRPEWEHTAVFDGVVAPGKAFAVDLGEASLPVMVELAAEKHVGVALHVVLPEQLDMPPAWLRRGEPVRLRVEHKADDDDRVVVWGAAWADAWGWVGGRWWVAVPHTEVRSKSTLDVQMPPGSWALWFAGVAESGAYGTAQPRGGAAGSVTKLEIDSAPVAVRVWDERKRPVPGVRLRVAGSPLQAEVVTDDEGRAGVQAPMTGDWIISAINEEHQGTRTGRGRPDGEIDIDLEPRKDIELRWSEELGSVVIRASFLSHSLIVRPRAFAAGIAALPKLAALDWIEYWGPAIAPGRLRLISSSGPLPLKAEAAMRIEGRVVTESDTAVAGLPVWMRISRSAMSTAQSYGRSGRAVPLERPWLPWAVTDSAGRFSIDGLPPSKCEVEVRAPGLPVARSERIDGAPGKVVETTVKLTAGARLALRATDPGGAPLAGVTVDLHRSEGGGGGAYEAYSYFGRAQRGDPEMTASTDEEGRCVLASVPVGAVRLRLSRPGSVTRNVDRIQVPADGIDIGDQVLQPGVTLSGTTVGPDGGAVGEAEVAIGRNPQMSFFQPEATSDDDGRFSIPDLEPSGEVYLQARAEGLVPEAPLKVEMPPDGEIEIVMAVERVLEGRVLDAQDDSPVEGASVTVRIVRSVIGGGSRPTGQYHVRVGDSKTDSSGGFRVAGLSDGEFVLVASAEGMRNAQQRVVIGEAITEPLVIRLEPGLELRGRVETAGGSPAAGLRVSAAPASRSYGGGATPYSRSQTDTDGRFHFDDLAPGTLSVSVRSEEGMTAEATAEAGQLEEIVLRFPRGTTISGTVYGPEGSPQGGAMVRGFGQGGRPESDETGSDGRFELKNIVPGKWTLWAEAKGLARASETVEVREGEPVTIDLRLERGATVVGEVRGLSGSELESCAVRSSGGDSTRPAADGSFRLTGVPSGESQVTATELKSARSRMVRVAVPETGESELVVIDFDSGFTIFGRVLRGGVGVPGLTVSVYGVVISASGDTISGPDGGWRVAGLEPGEYRVAVHSQSGEILAGYNVLLETDTELDLHLPTGVLVGRVLEADTRRPVEGALVTVSGSTVPPILRTVSSDATGAFEITEIGDGTFTVTAKATGRMPAQEVITLADGAVNELDLLLEADSTTVLVVQEADGSPASEIWIESLAGGMLGPSISSTCMAGGRCEVKDLARSRWTMMVRGRGMALVVVEIPQNEIPIQLRNTGVVKIKTPEVESGAAWQVRLVDSSTGIVAPVSAWYNPARSEWVPVRASGLMLGLPEGGWRIEAASPDGTMSVHDVTLTAGETAEVNLE